MTAFAITDPDAALDAVAHRLHEAIGLRPDGVSAIRLRHAVRDVARRRGVSPTALPALLLADPSCRQELVDRVTVQESRFFRDDGCFQALASRILPSLPAGEEVCVWSAGCANGQEAYSVAMLLAESGRTRWRVHGTDVSERALSAARAGSFAERELRGLDEVRRERFLVADAGGRRRIAAGLRARVDFAAHNIVSDPPPPKVAGARLVLLRNVLIYFEPATVAAVLARLAVTLPAGAWVLLGGSEVLHQTPGLELVTVDGTYGYRVTGRRQAGGAPVRRAATAVPPAAPAYRAEVPAAASPSPSPSPDDLRERGERHAAAGEHDAAIRCFRQLVYLDGRDVAARLALALSFEAAGDGSAATRCLRATATAIAVCAETDGDCEPVTGWRAEDLLGLIDERLAALEVAR